MIELSCHQQAQRCIVPNTLLANEGHCIDPGTGIVVGAKKPDVLDPGRHRPPGRGMFLTGYLTLPLSSGKLLVSCVVDKGVAAMHLAVAQYKDAANFIGDTIAGSGSQRVEPVLNHDCFATASLAIKVGFSQIIGRQRMNRLSKRDWLVIAFFVFVTLGTAIVILNWLMG